MTNAWRVSVAVAASLLACGASSQDYPSRPIRLISPFAPGGGTDILGRAIAVPASQLLGQSIVVDNRPGAGSTLGADLAVRAEPDGYTLIIVSASYCAASAYQHVRYDPVKDIEPIILVGTTGLVLVTHPAVPVHSVKELIAYARANPGKLNYASVGPGSVVHLSFELFKIRTGTHIVHVPYKGGGPALNAVLGEEVQLSAISMVPTIPHVRAGRLRALAITNAKRSPLLPDVPSLGETVPGYDVTHWYGVWGPHGMPRNIVVRLNSVLAQVLHKPEMAERLKVEGLELAAGPPEQFASVVSSDVRKWKAVIKEAKLGAASQ
jgi:tripartite-type tricarboxylate transporter receptor subunit TctC